jgi:hypothetical protein
VNFDIRNFRDTLIALCNNSDLPIEVKRLVFSEINALLKQEADKTIIVEHNANNKKEEVHDNEL